MERQIASSWRKSSFSSGNGGNCVEVRSEPGAVFVRDTKDQGRGLVLRLTSADWQRLTAGLR